jgi:5-methylcytosine-specific restriction endonuclease McrA
MTAVSKWRHLYKVEALTEQDGCCAYCKSPLTVRTATADHKWPQARKGRTTRKNIVAACRPCNQAKGDTPPTKFYRLIDRKLPRGAPPEILLIWFSRRIWKRTHRARAKIEKYAK